MRAFRKFTFAFVAGFLPERFPRRRPRRMLAAAACLPVFALLLGAGAAQAQSSVKLVGNTGQSTDARSSVSLYRAQAFTTGGNSGGYTLTGVEIEAANTPTLAETSLLGIYQSNTNNRPRVGDLSPVGTLSRVQGPDGTVRFATPRYALKANTTYFAVLLRRSSDGNSGYDLTNSDAEDSGAASGWSIGDGSLWKNSWSQAWSTSGASLKMSIHVRGRAVSPTRATVNGSSLTLTFDQALDEDSVPAAGAFRVKTFHGAGHGLPRCTGWCTFAASEVSVSGSTVTLTLPRPIPSHGDAWLTYEVPDANWLRTAAPGGFVESFRERGVGVLTPNTAPVFEFARARNGKYLWIEYNEVVTGDSVPGSAFTVTATSEGVARTIAGTGTVHVSNPSADGYSGSVRVTLASAVAPGEGLTVSYVKPSGNQIHDRDDAPVESHSDMPVTNLTQPGFKPTGATVNGSSLTLAFHQALDEDSVPAGSAFYVYAHHGGGHDLPRCAGCRVPVSEVSVTGATAILTLAEPIPSHARAAMNYEAPAANPLQSAVPGRFVENFRALTVRARTPNTVPVFDSAHVAGKLLTVSHNEAVTGDSVPGSAFTVTATSDGGTRRTIAGTGTVQVLEGGLGGYGGYGGRVRVTLASAVAPGERLSVSYVKPSGNQLRDRADAPVESYADKPATNGQPRVEAVAIVSDPQGGDGDTYGLGDTIRVQVTFDVPVTAETSRGMPRLAIDLDPAAWGEKWASYESGSGTDTLTFSYTVVEPNLSTGGIAVKANGLERNGGRIIASSSFQFPPVEANLAHAGLDHDPAHKVDWTMPGSGGGSGGSGPSHLSSSVSGTQLKVTFDEALDEGSAPPGGSFKVTVAPGGGAGGNGGAGANGGSFGTGAQATSGVRATSGVNAGGDIEGTGTVTVNGAEVVVTLARPAPPGATLTVSYTPPDQSPLRDLEGEEAEEFSGAPVTHAAPAVTGVAVVSDGGADDTYALGQRIRVAVTFSEAVVVDTAGGAPGLTIDMDPADWGEKRAAYESGSGTATLVFTHTVVEPNVSTEGVAVPADSLSTGGGTIRSASGADAVLAHAGLDHDPKHKVDWTLAPDPNRAPVVDEGSQNYAGFVASGNAPRGVLVTKGFHGMFSDPDGDELTYTVALSDPGQAGLVETLHVPTEAELAETPRRIEVARRVFFRADAEADWGAMEPAVPDPVSIAVTVTATDPGGLSASVEGVFLTHWAAPRVESVAVVSNAGSDDTYALGETIRVAVRFDGRVAVDTSGGTPRIRIDMDPADWGAKWASYAGGSGTSELVFAYEVVEPNYSTEGIAVLADTLETNGGTIRLDTSYRSAPWMDADLAHPGLGHDPKHKVDWGLAPTPVGASPAVTGVAVASDAGPDDTYALGDVIRVAVTFDAAVTVTGSPGITIDMDPAPWGEKRAAYESGSGTASLVFAHTVVEPNYSTEGIAVLADSLALEGGAIRSASGADAALAHAGLAHDAKHKVDWRPELSVADARADEGAGATVDFEVPLSRAYTNAEHSVTVDYATADGTATAGEDYTAASGTLTFAAGETVKTVRVALLDDAIDEGEETFTLRLSNARGARVADGEATGTIVNSDPMPRAWLARFGRAAAEHVTDAIGERLRGSPGTRMTLGGHELDWSADPDALPANGSALLSGTGLGLAGGGPLHANSNGFGLNGRTGEDGDAPARELSMPDLLLASSFHMASADGADGTRSGRWSVWGRGARSSFEGMEGRLSIEGDVTTATLGFDYERGHWLAGVALSRSSGEGSYEEAGMRGEVESSLTGVYPYARYRVSESLSLWGVVGFGAGDMTLEPEGTSSIETDIETGMAAAGARGVLLPARAAGGFELALRADLMATATSSDAAANLVETEVETSRIRLLLEASREFRTGADSVLAASAEAGLRYDGGDAETGSGLEAGGSLRWTSGSLSVEVAARGLMAHSEDDYEEWGVSGSVQYAPGSDGRGFSLKAGSAWGAAAGGAERIWSQRAAGLAGGDFAPGASVDAEAGYGFRFRGGLLTPYTGVALSESSETWRAGARWKLGAATELALEANLRENAGGDAPESGVLLKGSRRW